MESSKITIGIPVYNQGEFLSDAIESALSQKCEVIVVDDGSLDNSLEIAKIYPVKVISQVNKGLASARNSLIMNMTGEFFLPLDADDILLENCVEKMLEAIKENPEADIIAPSFKEFGISSANVILKDNVTLEDFKLGNHLPYFSAIRKSKLLEIGGYSPKMTWGWEDYALWINLLSRGAKVATLKDVLVLYRTKEKSMIHEANLHAEELMAQIRKDFPTFYE